MEVHLFTPYYESDSFERQQEVLQCIQNNLKCNLISKIYLISDRKYNSKIKFLQHEKIVMREYYERQSFDRMVANINTTEKNNNCISIMCNSDIYFDDVAIEQIIACFDLNKCLCLSRYDVQIDGTTKPFLRDDSQDAWVFYGNKQLSIENVCFYFGLPGCDNRFAYELAKSGLTVYNPSRSIKIYHLHLSAQREKGRRKMCVPRPYLLVPPCSASDVQMQCKVVKKTGRGVVENTFSAQIVENTLVYTVEDFVPSLTTEKSMNILLVSWYHIGDGITPAVEQLKQEGHRITNVGLCIEKKTVTEGILSWLTEKKIDIVLFWNWRNASLQCYQQAKNHQCIVVVFDWDAPHSWQAIQEKAREKCAYIDVAMTCSQEAQALFLQYGAKQSIVAYPCFSPKIHFFDFESNYECDVSFMCTNLYESPLSKYHAQLVPRKDIIDAIYAQRAKISFRLYGPPNVLMKTYPDCYGGQYIRYDNSRKVFSSARITLNQHGVNSEKYLNERCVTAMASGAVMLVDRCKGFNEILKEGIDCEMYSSVDECMEKITVLLADDEKRKCISENARKTAAEMFSQQRWTSQMFACIRREQSETC